ncbi:MAG: cation transporter [Acidimicrobiales bacterium]
MTKAPTVTTVTHAEPARQALRLEYATLGWNSLEAVVAVASGILAASVALTGFGLDSGIELVSAAIVLLRLRALLRAGEPDEAKEHLALRAVAGCFFALAAYIAAAAAFSLVRTVHPAASPSGIAITAGALLVMPGLSLSKRRVADRLSTAGYGGAAALVRADAAETMLCASMSVTTLLGVGLDAALGWWWADPVAGLAIVYFAIKEGREAWKGDLCCD